MELISYIVSENEGTKTTTIVFNPTMKPIWVIPKKDDKNHGTLISYDPITGEETSKIVFDHGKQVGEKVYEKKVTHAFISLPGEVEPESWAWAFPESQQLLAATIYNYVQEQKKKNAEIALLAPDVSNAENPPIPIKKLGANASVRLSFD